MKISVVLIVKNEEKRIKACLESVKWTDEIVVVDDGSTDKTVDIAKKFTEYIFTHKSQGYVEAARNFALSKASNDWTLLLDADEIIPSTLAEVLKNIAEDKELTYVKIPRKNIIFNQWIEHSQGWWPDYQLRFFRKGKVTWPGKIHAQPEVSGKGRELEPTEENAIIHQNYESVSQFLEKLDRYTTIEAKEKGSLKSWEEAWNTPSDEFVSRFFARDGYKDGLHGLILSLLEAFYAEIVFAKQWENDGFPVRNDLSFLEKNYILMEKIALQCEYWYIQTKIKEENNPLMKTRLKLRMRGITKKLSTKKQ